MTTETDNGDLIQNFDDGDNCPVHDTPHRNTYTYGSTMSGETDVCIFKGCRCAVSIKHDPAGGDSSAMYHTRYTYASGRGLLHAMECAAKYR